MTLSRLSHLAAAASASALLASGALALQDADPDQRPSAQRYAGGPHFVTSTAGTLEVIFCNIPTSPFSDVPAGPLVPAGAKFHVGSSSSSAFDQPFGSPNTQRWILSGFINDDAGLGLDGTNDEFIMVDGVVVAREGTPAPFAPGENWGFMDQRMDINDSGQYVVTNNVNPSTVDDDYAVRVTPGSPDVYDVLAQEGAVINPLAPTTYDDAIDSPIIDNLGRTGFHADFVDGGAVTSTDDELVLFDDAVILRENTTMPVGQAGGATELDENFDFEDYWVSGDGGTILYQGDLTGTTTGDDIVALYDTGTGTATVVLQEDGVVPGMVDASPISSITEVFLSGSGDWMARGSVDGGTDFVVYNGVTVAETGQPVITGGTELWDDTDFASCFFLEVANNVGDYVVGGVTNNTLDANGVLVLNDSLVLAREGDPVDVDGNGLFDDDAFIDLFGNDDAILMDDGTLLFVASLDMADETDLGQAFLRVKGGSMPPDPYCSGDGSATACPCGNVGAPGAGCDNSFATGGALLTATGSSSVSSDTLSLNGSGMGPTSPGLYFQGTAQQNGGLGDVFGDGLRCVGGTVIRLGTKTSAGGASTYPDAGDPSVSVKGMVPAGGGVRHYQIWYRNAAPFCTAATFNLSNAVTVTWTP